MLGLMDRQIVTAILLAASLLQGGAAHSGGYVVNWEPRDLSAGQLFAGEWQADEAQVLLSEPFIQLQQHLERKGFEVRLQRPPLNGAYGLLEASSRTIWIHPVVFDLGIAQPVLVHEAVHAAQACAGNGTVAALNLGLDPPNNTRPFFLRYHSYRRQIESEAYAIQVQPDRYERVLGLLEQHCGAELP